MSDRETLEAILELINDYGVGLTGDMRAKALALIEEGQAARERAAIMAEQAAYALRYRSGEDIETLRKTCRAIVHIEINKRLAIARAAIAKAKGGAL